MEAFLKNDIKTAIFVALGALAFMISIIVLGGDHFLFSNTVTLRTRFPQVQGLAQGSIVSLAGVPIGNIKKLRFVPNVTDIEVEMDISKEQLSRITKGSLASIKTQGALGDKYIYITPGPTDAESLKANDLLEADQQKDLIDIILIQPPAQTEAQTRLAGALRGQRQPGRGRSGQPSHPDPQRDRVLKLPSRTKAGLHHPFLVLCRPAI